MRRQRERDRERERERERRIDKQTKDLEQYSFASIGVIEIAEKSKNFRFIKQMNIYCRHTTWAYKRTFPFLREYSRGNCSKYLDLLGRLNERGECSLRLFEITLFVVARFEKYAPHFQCLFVQLDHPVRTPLLLRVASRYPINSFARKIVCWLRCRWERRTFLDAWSECAYTRSRSLSNASRSRDTWTLVLARIHIARAFEDSFL